MASFGEALEKIKQGKKAQRSGWDEAKWVALSDAAGDVTEEFLMLHTADLEVVPWTPTHGDLLAENWEGA
jgi:hypothetical protein